MNKDNNTNFWVSYADLMAGLLFVFILLIGAIIVKYSLLESESDILEKDLQQERAAHKKSNLTLALKEQRIEDILKNLEKTELVLSDVSGKLKYNKEVLQETLIQNDELKSFIIKNRATIEEQQEQLFTKDELIETFKNQLKNNKLALKEKTDENTNLKNALESSHLTLKEKESLLDKMLNEIIAKENLIKSFKQINTQLDDEIIVLNEKIKRSQEEQEAFAKDLESTKIKIKNLTGIKVRVITILKESLGEDMYIDPNNGSITLSSNVLFDEGEYQLKASAKSSIEKDLYNYLNEILENENINKHIDKIMIEGHANTKGSFLYNLNLSQQRAYAVMDFLLSLEFEKKEELKQLIVASGRSFLDPIYDEENIENQEASRRIEIKFSLKNEEAIKEIEAILDNNY